MNIKVKANYVLWTKLTLIYFLTQLIIRIIFIAERPPGFIDSADAILDGLAWDIGTWSILSIPLLIFSLVLHESKHEAFNRNKSVNILIFFFCFSLFFISFSELLFWNEFHSRFNFIAVDYLIYTNEVLTNLKESFPMGKIIALILLLSTFITFLSYKLKFKDSQFKSPLSKANLFLVFGLLFPLLFIFSIGPWLESHDEEFHDDQISRNGLYEFVRAFRSNRIEYKAFYKTIDPTQAKEIINSSRKEISASGLSLSKKPNIVMIVVESLGAKFIKDLGGNPEATPFLNNLANESLFFENFYATGTRTVRGLEALTLSVPPTPGYAVVKRPNHKGLYSIGYTFSQNGYDTTFMYGGRGFFDNMNSFFSGNGFKIIDQTDFNDNEATFKNAWGVCDEDLFNKALKEIDSHASTNKPFFKFLLTTSNHRPFTYPDGKIDIPSGSSRLGAVKYTDYAIGKFLESAIKKDWASNTIFIVVADHSTEGRGQFDLEMSDYHIPLWIYSKSLIQPQRISKLGSQIDLLPSLIHLLGLKDDSPYFGQSLFNDNWKEERAFIGNYQYVGFYKNKVLTTLGPNRVVRNYTYDPVTKKQEPTSDSPYVDETVSYYQIASDMLDTGKYSNPLHKVKK